MTQSVYELLNPLTQERKTRFWDWFDGDALRNWWTEIADTSGMNDSVDGGYRFSTSASINNASNLYQNGISHYTSDGVASVIVWKCVTNTLNRNMNGFSSDGSTLGSNWMLAGVRTSDDANNWVLRSKDAGTASNTISSNAHDTNFHIHKIDLDQTSADWWIDGILDVTKTSNLPAASTALELIHYNQTLSNAVRSVDIRYWEAYNT